MDRDRLSSSLSICLQIVRCPFRAANAHSGDTDCFDLWLTLLWITRDAIWIMMAMLMALLAEWQTTSRDDGDDRHSRLERAKLSN